ncbi:extracellular solute-binding protein [Ferdinandcohnia sp. SAFN-114]|uniref:extracellular solute-binding protein n=1 Tax=Ferdinandcohnia sp. SAFN-114 TaxID=3387275 RepID=UPI003F821785
MKFKKQMKIAGTVLLASSLLLGACSNKEEVSKEKEAPKNLNATGYPIVNEALTLEMMGQSSPLQPNWGDMNFFKKMKELTNMDFTYRTSTSDQYAQQKQLAFTSMELPDVFFGANFTAAEEVDYGTQGLLAPLEDLIDQYAPNLQKVMEKYPDLKSSITAPDGHIYALPGIDTSTTSQVPIMWMNGYWLKNLGVDKRPESTEELYQLLKDYKEKDPNKNGKADEIPLTASSVAELRYHFMPAFGINQQGGIFEKDGKVGYAFVQDGYKEYLKYLNRLYSEKLLDQQVFSHTWEQYVAKGAEDLVGVFPTWPIVMVGYADPTLGANYPLLPPLTSELNNQKLMTKLSEIKRGRAAISSENEQPEATMRWLDYMYSEEGTYLARLGVEGENWEWDDKGNWKLLAPEGMNTTQANAQHAPGAGTPVPMVLEQEFFAKEDNPTIHLISGWIEEEYLPYAELPFPQVYFTEEEQAKLNTIKPDLDSYLEQMEAKFVSGQASIEGEWDNFVKTLNKLGAEEMAKINQAAYDRWAEAK